MSEDGVDQMVSEAAAEPAAPRKHGGVNYIKFMRRLAETLTPRTYFEIGTRNGRSLAQMDCGSVAVDPRFVIEGDFLGKKPFCHLFQCTSDHFFRDHDLTRVAGGPVDFAFLDGLHLFEYTLRDFINTERHCRPNSLIAIHDCLPTTVGMAGRIGAGGAWCGDVWKLLIALKRFRPEIRLHALDCAPTGLVLCTNLDPRSSVLSDRYHDIVDDLVPLDMADDLSTLYDQIPVLGSKDLLTHERLSRLVWL